MKTALRSILRLFSGLVLAVVLLATVAFIQLARGPLALGPFVPYVESALARVLPGYTFNIADAELTWRRMTRRPELTVKNVQIRNASGGVIGAFGALDLRLDIPQLVRGRVVIEHLNLSRPVVRIVRAADGAIRLGMDAGASVPPPPATQVAPAPPATTAPEDGQRTSGFASVLMDGLRVSPDDPEAGPALENIEITQSTIVFVDEQSGLQWLVPDANLRLLGQRETIEIAGSLPLIGGGATVAVDVAGRYTYEAGLLSLTASFNGLRPSAFAALAPEVEELKILDVPINGSVEVNLVPDNVTSNAAWGTIKLNGGAGTLVLPPEQGGTIPVSGIELRAATSGGLDQIALEKFEVRIARTDGLSPTIGARGKAINLRTKPEVDIQASIDGLTVQGLKDLWPATLAANTRGWIERNLTNGTVRNVTATIGMSGEEPWAPKVDALKLRGDLEGITVNYINGMPKILNTKGVLNVGLQEVRIDVTGGDVPDPVSKKGLRVTAADLRMFDLTTPIPKADFDIKIKGDLGEALRLIENEPLKYASSMGVDPMTATGPVDVDLALKFPLLSNLKMDQLQVGVKAKVAGGRIEKVLFGMPLSDGDLALEVTNAGLKVDGTAKIGEIVTTLGWTQDFTGAPQRAEYVLDAAVSNADRPSVQLGFFPFMPPNIDGTVRTHVVYRTMRDGTATLQADGSLGDVALAIPELGWSKPEGTPAHFKAVVTLKDGLLVAVPSFSVTAENDLDIEGTATFGEQAALRTLSITKGRANKTDMTWELTRDATGAYDVKMDGPVFDASYFWRELNKDEKRGLKTDGADVAPEQPKDQVPITLTAKVGEMWLNKDAPPLKAVGLDFARNSKAIQKIQLHSYVESGATFDFALSSNNGERTFSGRSSDGGGVVRSIGLFDDIKGGSLIIKGSLTPDGAVEGQADISEFNLVDAPMVARVLSVAALTGIVDELRGQGISFKTLRVPFSFKESTLRISDAEMFGSSLGMTAEGSYRFSDSYIDVNGTVIPAYTLNSALNSIPIVGTLLTGTEKGGGIFAATFTWQGPSATAEPSVNPLSVLAPGILRKIFSIFRTSPKPPPAAAPAPVQP